MTATLSTWSLAAIPARILPAAPVSPLVILKPGTLPLAQTVAVFGWAIMSALGLSAEIQRLPLLQLHLHPRRLATV